MFTFNYFICLEIPQNFARNKKIVSLLKILSWKPSFAKKSDWVRWVFTLLMSHNNLHASSNFFSHWRCLLYFICLEIPQNFARNKNNCIIAKDLILKAEFLKQIWLIDMSLHTVTRSREDKSVIWWIIILRNFFCDILHVKKSHQNHAIYLKSWSDTLYLCYFECMVMWYEHVYDVVRTCT